MPAVLPIPLGKTIKIAVLMVGLIIIAVQAPIDRDRSEEEAVRALVAMTITNG